MSFKVDEHILDVFSDSEKREALFAEARKVRAEHFGNKVFAYGFNYYSTYCRNECAFCLYRCNNAHAPRYRHSAAEIVDSACRLAESGVHVIDLTMGEDPYFLSHPQRLVDVVAEVSRATGLPVMMSPGAIHEDVLVPLRQAGATWLALYQETYDRKAFAKLRIGQSFDGRVGLRRAALDAGLLVEDGILTGWGDTPESLVASLQAMGQGRPSQVRTMTFVPQPGTPLAALEAQNCDWEMVAIAVMRLLYPDLLIPASLDVEGPDGLIARLNAGANVVTSIIPPGAGLEGVARTKDIEDGGRTLDQIAPRIREAGLDLASQQDYAAFVAAAQERTLGQGTDSAQEYLQVG